MNQWEDGCVMESVIETKEDHEHSLYCEVVARALEEERTDK